MVPFSFLEPLLKSRVMKERSLALVAPRFPNRVQRHAGLVGQTCRFAPIKKLHCLPMLPSKNPPEPSPFPGTQPARSLFTFYPCPPVFIRGLKTGSSTRWKLRDFRRFKVIYSI